MALILANGGGKSFTTADYVTGVSLPYTVSNCHKGDIVSIVYGSSSGTGLITVTGGTIIGQTEGGGIRVGITAVVDADGSVTFNGTGSVSGVVAHIH